FWVNLVAAVNGGTGPLRGPSQLVVATAGQAGSTPPQAIAPQALANGSDGAGAVTADTLPRAGMYALRSQGCSIALLADADDPTTWTTQAGFGLSEGIYMVLTGPSGDSITTAI